MKTLVVTALFACLFVSPVMAEDEEGCIQIAKDYVGKHGTQDEGKKFESHWKGMVQTAADDAAQEDEESFINRYIFNWMADRKARFEQGMLSVKDKLEACRIYLIFKNLNGDGTQRRKGGNKYLLPSRVAEYLTVENIKKYVAEDLPAVKTTSAEKEEAGEKWRK